MYASRAAAYEGMANNSVSLQNAGPAYQLGDRVSEHEK